jgi:ribosomal protein S18 acetylase RimI-like enzyme
MNNIFKLKMAELSDLHAWMEMIEIVKNNFPHLDTEKEINDYKQTVIKNINRNSAICVKYEKRLVGLLIFSYNQKCISCMAVHPGYRRKGIASAMIEKMISLLPQNEDIWVITFRAEDQKGIAPRSLYKKFGFDEGELLIEREYPHQKFILHRTENPFYTLTY